VAGGMCTCVWKDGREVNIESSPVWNISGIINEIHHSIVDLINYARNE